MPHSSHPTIVLVRTDRKEKKELSSCILVLYAFVNWDRKCVTNTFSKMKIDYSVGLVLVLNVGLEHTYRGWFGSIVRIINRSNYDVLRTVVGKPSRINALYP